MMVLFSGHLVGSLLGSQWNTPGPAGTSVAYICIPILKIWGMGWDSEILASSKRTKRCGNPP